MWNPERKDKATANANKLTAVNVLPRPTSMAAKHKYCAYYDKSMKLWVSILHIMDLIF